jgi:hypothetical protein
MLSLVREASFQERKKVSADLHRYNKFSYSLKEELGIKSPFLVSTGRQVLQIGSLSSISHKGFQGRRTWTLLMERASRSEF